MQLSRMLRLIAPVFGTVLLATDSHAGIVYSQSPDYPSNYNALTSQSQASGGAYEAFDNFSLAANATIASVAFQGFYWNPNGPALNPPPLPSTQNLQVGFYENGTNNLPGTFLGAFALNNFQSVSAGTSYFGPDNTGQNDLVNIYNFAGNLSAPLALTAHTQYWISFVSFAGPTPPLWLWTSSAQGDGKSLQYRYVAPAYANISRDRTFSLSTDTVGTLLGGTGPNDPPVGQLAEMPEPGSMTLLAIGLVSCVGAKRLRRKSKLAMPSAA